MSFPPNFFPYVCDKRLKGKLGCPSFPGSTNVNLMMVQSRNSGQCHCFQHIWWSKRCRWILVLVDEQDCGSYKSRGGGTNDGGDKYYESRTGGTKWMRQTTVCWSFLGSCQWIDLKVLKESNPCRFGCE